VFTSSGLHVGTPLDGYCYSLGYPSKSLPEDGYLARTLSDLGAESASINEKYPDFSFFLRHILLSCPDFTLSTFQTSILLASRERLKYMSRIQC
jgi:hypothetical protein